MRNLLDQYLTVSAESGFRKQLVATLQDPFKKSSQGGFRLSPLWIGLGTLAAVAIAVFLYFNVAWF